MRSAIVMFVVLALAACGGQDDSTTGAEPAPDGGDEPTQDISEPETSAEPDGDQGTDVVATDTGPAPEIAVDELDNGTTTGCEAPHTEIVTLTTDDGVTLEGDLYTSGDLDAPGVVLLHMIPPSNDRSGYPVALCESLAAQGYNVLNIDRRGAGASGGVAEDAYSGPNGKLDPHAAVQHLLQMPCGSDPTRVAVVGASNGTTSALDYTVWSVEESAAVTPRVLVYLTGGGYTENQNTIADNLDALGAIESLFVYSTEEAAWSAGIQATAPASWVFQEYPGGAHGTNMFETKPESMDDLRAFLEGAL